MADETVPRERILVIDDELGLREGCRRALTRYGYEVDVAATSREGWAKARAAEFAVVLLDVMMPDISGIELLELIHTHQPETICLIITGYATVELAVQAMKLGAYDFIAKPFSDDHLLVAVEKAIEKRHLQQEARRAQQMEDEARRLTQEKAMLEELDRVKSAFMRKVAHELRAPVAAIRSFLTLILQGYASPDQERQMQQRSAERADELLNLIDDLLNLARLKDLKFPSKREQVSVEEVLKHVLSLHAPEAEGKGIVLTVETHPCGSLAADPTHIQQLWTNLISNAIKYTPRGGKVTIHLTMEDAKIVGEVGDTGIGISAEDLPRLFEEFFRTERAKAFAEHGTGLGLSIARQIVQQYGGDITVESELAKGTRFTFWLPVGESAQRSE